MDDCNEKEEAPRVHHREYERGVQDAILWLVENSETYKAEYLAQHMQRDLLL